MTALDREAFTVYEDGKRQPITLFRKDDVPVSIGLLIDNSGSMRTRRAHVEAAALAFVRASNPLDEVFVINFADKVRVDVAMTSDIRTLEAGIARVDSIGGTAMRDAIEHGERYLAEHATRDRRVLLVVTDGNDNASTASPSQIQQPRGRARGLRLRRRSTQRRGAVEAQTCEARARSPGRDHRRPRILPGERQRDRWCRARPRPADSQPAYTIAYAPSNQALDGSYRKIKVTATDHEPLIVHTRAGYRATPAGSTP